MLLVLPVYWLSLSTTPWIPYVLCSFCSAVCFQFVRTTYPMVPRCLQAVIPVLTPPPETPPLSTSVGQKTGSVKCLT